MSVYIRGISAGAAGTAKSTMPDNDALGAMGRAPKVAQYAVMSAGDNGADSTATTVIDPSGATVTQT